MWINYNLMWDSLHVPIKNVSIEEEIEIMLFQLLWLEIFVKYIVLITFGNKNSLLDMI